MVDLTEISAMVAAAGVQVGVIYYVLDIAHVIWNGIIPALPVGTNVTYMIIAQDNSGSSINSTSQGYTFDYSVVIPARALKTTMSALMTMKMKSIFPFFQKNCRTWLKVYSRLVRAL